jgi:Phage tail baseplate hub (GPD)
MMTFHLMTESMSFQVIAFTLRNDGVCAHYRWWLTVRCRPNDISLLQQWGRVSVSNAFGVRHWHGVITEQTDYGIWQGWHYWQINLASPLASLAWWIGNRTWVEQQGATIISQICQLASWREGIHFAITSNSGRQILPLVIAYNESGLSVLDRICTQCGCVFYWRQQTDRWQLHIDERLPDDGVEWVVANETGMLRQRPTLIRFARQYTWIIDHIHCQTVNMAQPAQPHRQDSRHATPVSGYSSLQLVTQERLNLTLWQQQLDWQRVLVTATSDAAHLLPGQLLQLREDDTTVNDYRILQITAQGEWFSCFHAGDSLPDALAGQLTGLSTGFWPQLTLCLAEYPYRKPNEFTTQLGRMVQDEVSILGCRINPSLLGTLLARTIKPQADKPPLNDWGDYYVQWIFARHDPQNSTYLLPMAHLNQFHWPQYPDTWLVAHGFRHEVTPRFCGVGVAPRATMPDVLTGAASPQLALMRQYNQMTWCIDESTLQWRDSQQQVNVSLPTGQATTQLNAQQGKMQFTSECDSQFVCGLDLLAQAATLRCLAGKDICWQTRRGNIEFMSKQQLYLQAELNVMGFAKQKLTVQVDEESRWRLTGNMYWFAEHALTVRSSQPVHLTYQQNAYWTAEQQAVILSAGLGKLKVQADAIEFIGDAISFNASVIYLHDA